MNGCEGIVVDILFPELEHIIHRSDLNTIILLKPPTLIFRPDYINNNLKSFKLFQTFNGIPIVSTTDSMKVPIHNGCELQPVTVLRNQLPFVGAYAMTTYKIQGKTVPSIICDTEKIMGDHGTLYVMLSRVKSSNQMILTKKLTLKMCNTDLPQDLRSVISRFQL